VLARIFLGEIKQWNDPAIAALNPELKDKLPARKIRMVHREDSSGTTLVFTEYLHSASPTWAKTIGKPSSKVAWPVEDKSIPVDEKCIFGVERNIGVANKVFSREDSIGYIDLLYAQNKQYHFQYAAVLNKEGKAFLHAESKYLEAAIQQVLPTIPESLEFNLANQSGADSYPICGVIWASCYQNQPAAEVQKVTDFLTWILHEGQTPATFASYAPLPPELIERAEAKVKQIKAGP
jgi:phosphate transport system substrate-binding protein